MPDNEKAKKDLEVKLFDPSPVAVNHWKTANWSNKKQMEYLYTMFHTYESESKRRCSSRYSHHRLSGLCQMAILT